MEKFGTRKQIPVSFLVMRFERTFLSICILIKKVCPILNTGSLQVTIFLPDLPVFFFF